MLLSQVYDRLIVPAAVMLEMGAALVVTLTDGTTAAAALTAVRISAPLILPALTWRCDMYVSCKHSAGNVEVSSAAAGQKCPLHCQAKAAQLLPRKTSKQPHPCLVHSSICADSKASYHYPPPVFWELAPSRCALQVPCYILVLQQMRFCRTFILCGVGPASLLSSLR
jgi:hypothetical protein